MIQTGGTTQLGLYEFKGKVDGAIEQFQVDSAAALQEFQNSSNTEITQFETQANAALAKVESTGGLISVPTLTALQAITSAYANQSAIVEATGAYYRWNASGTPPAWVATGRNFLTEAAADATTKANAAQANAISAAAADATTKANNAQNNAVTAANTNTDNKFTAYMTGTQVLVKNYAAADFSVIDSYVQTGIFSTNPAFNRTDYIAVKSGDVINLSVYLPAGVMGSFFSSDYTYITDINKTVNNGSNGYSTGTYTAAQDGFIIANQNKGNATYANPTIVVTSKDRLVANSNLNTVGSGLGYTKYISQLGGTDLLVDAYFANTNLTPNTSVYSTFGGSPGDFNNKFNQGFRIYALGYTALVSLPIPVYAGTRIKGSVARSTNQQSLLILDANKKPLKFLDAVSTANTSLQSVDIIIDVDGYLVIQHHSITLQCNLRLFGKTRLLNSDLKDKPSGYLSYDYYVANVDKKTELNVTDNIKSVTNINRTKFTSLGVLADDTGYQASAYITCLPNLTFILENLFTRGGASLINFYDANYNFLAGVYGDSNILSYQRITSPENTAYVRFCRGIDTVYGSSYTNSNGTIITFDMAKFKLVMNASGVYYYTNYLLPMLTDQFLDVRGDSIGSGIAGSMINSGLIRTPTVRDFTVGGENVLDSMLRAGATSVEMKTKGLTVPVDGTAVTVDAYFDFTRTVTYNADGTYTNSGGFKRANWGPNGTNIPFEYDGQKFFVDLSKDNVSTIRFQSAQAAAYSFTKDTAFSTKRGTNKGLLFLMMGTNGGFGITADDAAFDNLLMMHKRITDTYQGKCMVAGYYFVPVAKKAYFRKIMESHYGERFVDFETHILTRGLSEMQITLNAEEKAFIAQYQGLTTGGGNSALPFFSGDNTHPGGVSYRCFTNEMLRRAYLLGFIDKLYQLDLQIPTAAMITTVTQPAASIAVGATTTAQVGLNGSDAYLFEWTSSNPAVASVPTRKWTPPNANYGSWSSIVITGVSAGTATITCTCRHGGATKTFDITVT